MTKKAGTATRRERLQEREQAIIAAAHDVFVEGGFEGATIAAIARRAEVAEGTIYLYFKNKHALLQAVVGAFYEGLTAGADAGVADVRGTYDRLLFLARHHLEHCLAEWPILQLLVGQYRQMPVYESTEYYRFNKAYVAVFDRVIVAGVERGEVRDDLPLHVIRDLFYGGLEYAVRTHLLRAGSDGEIGNIAGDLTRTVWRGIATGSTPPPTSMEESLPKLIQRLESATRRLEQAAADSEPR